MDTGFGIEEDKLKNLGQMFKMQDKKNLLRLLQKNDDNDFTSGIGLGLSTVSTLVHACGGKIFIASEPDKGTKITFSMLVTSISPEDPF